MIKFLKKSFEYNNIYQNHEKVFGKYFFLLYKNDFESGNLKVGVVASKKVGKAVVRNKIKRQVKYFFRTIGKNLINNKQIIVLAKRNLLSINWLMIKEDLSNILNLINKNEIA